MDRDQNLLFGVLAVQMEHITATQFVHAADVWATRCDDSLASHLVEEGMLTEGDREFLDDLLEKTVRDSGGSPEAALRNLGGEEAVRLASGGRITMFGPSGVSIRHQTEPQIVVHEPEHRLEATRTPLEQTRWTEGPSWNQIGIVCLAIGLLIAFAGAAYWQVLQDRNEAERDRLDAERARAVLQRASTDQEWQAVLDRETQRTSQDQLRHATLQRKVAETQKSIALEGLTKLTREIPMRLIAFPETLPVVKDFLEDYASTIDRVFELEPASDDLEREKAANYALLGSLWGSLGDKPKSIVFHQKALATAKRLAETRPEQTQDHLMLALRLDEMGLAYHDGKRYDEAVASFRISLDIYRALLDADLNDSTLHPSIAKTYNDLANTYSAVGGLAKAHTAYANSREFNRAWLLTESAIGAARVSERSDEALVTYNKTVQFFQALSETLSDESPGDSGLPLAYENIGLAYALQGRHDDAQWAFQKSLEADAGNTELSICRARVRSHQGLIYGVLEDNEKSKGAHAKSSKILHALLIEDPADTHVRQILASNSFALGQVRLRLGENEEALAEFKTMLEDCMHPSAKALLAPDQADSIHPLYVHAMGLLSHAGRTEETLQLHESYVALQRYFVDLDPNNADGLSTLAAEYVKLGMDLRRVSRIGEAGESFRAGLDILVSLASNYPENDSYRSRIEPIRQRLSRIEEGR